MTDTSREKPEKTTKDDNAFYAYRENPFRTIIEAYKQSHTTPLKGWYDSHQQTTA